MKIDKMTYQQTKQTHSLLNKTKVSVFALTIAIFATSNAFAQENKPAEVEADELRYFENESKIIASGQVNVTQPGRSLNAEEVIYNQKNGTITATSNVHFTDAANNHYYANKATMNDQLNSGTIEQLTGKLSDNSLISADIAERESDKVTILHQSAYSPCKVCVKKHGGKPFWQLTSEKVRIDENTERVSYKNTTLDIYGVPILYSPYFSHATPNAKRKSGFLIPSYSNQSTLGLTVKAPYYINISSNIDAIFEPIITSQEGVIASGSLRHLLESGSYEVSASITNPQKRSTSGGRIDGEEVRGHFQGKGNFSLTDKWGWGFDVKHTSDDTYLRRYKFGNEDRLMSRLFSDFHDDRNYIGAQSIFFQGLNANDAPENTPFILPKINAHFETTPLSWGSRITYDADILALHRDTGNDVRRFTNNIRWAIPQTTDGGHVLSFNTNVRADAYQVNNVQSTTTKDGLIGRVIPEASINWSYPLASHSGNTQIYLEPLADFIVSPNGGNPNKIPNEDSVILELSDTNLFSSNHFAGLDRVEGGARSNYGVRGKISNKNAEAGFLIGQSYRANRDENFSEESGLNDNFSDYVGRVGISNKKNGEISYRFRVDKDDFTIRRNEVGASLNFSPLTIGATYVNIDEIDNLFDRNEIAASANIILSSNWSINVLGRRDLAEGERNGESVGGWRSAGFGLSFVNECIIIDSSVRRDFVRDRDIEPSTTFLVKISLTNLGSL